ncbi:MAG: tetratricopeptide repeat protein [Acidobacteriota bacterium]|nr:MAG: tetratricopeptide repeat protein [Acidobacteriota bacterium]
MAPPMRFPIAMLFLVALLAPCSGPPEMINDEPPTYVGRETCAGCHAAETELWEGSHHDLAMQRAGASTVLGDFDEATFDYAGVTSTFFERDGSYFVRTDGPDGELTEYEVAYTFGVEPLQQYLVPFERGRYQALSIAWDSRPTNVGGGRWFHLYPDERIDHEDPLHWTKRYQSWNFMCSSCHSTGLRKNYELADDSYDTEFFEINVSCEACHGPGSRHVQWAEAGASGDPGLTLTLRSDEPVWVTDVATGLAERQPARSERSEIEMCAACHSRRGQLYEDDVHGQPFLDDYRPALLRDPLYYADGQIRDEVYVYGSFLQSKMYRKGVTCQDCHDPHGLHVRAEGNAMCASCHLPEKFDTATHHFHEPETRGSLCVDCHMPETTYMIVDPRRDHSFRIPRPDLTTSIGAPNACNGCHSEQSPAWAADAVADWFGHEPTFHYGEALHAAWSGAPGAADQLRRIRNEPDVPGIVKASAAALTPTMAALQSGDPLVRAGGLVGADGLDPTLKHQLVVPLLDDDVRAVRIEAARVLSSVPAERFTPEQRSLFTRVLEEYRDVQKLNADWPEAHMNLGVVDAQLGELERAEQDYRTALAIDPEFARAYVNLADLYRVMGQNDRSEEILRQAPDDGASVHHALGLTLVRLGRNEEALEELRVASELSPDEPRYAYVYGVALQSTGDVENSVRVLQKASERHPYDRDILVALVTTYRDRGAFRDALRYARRLAELNLADASVQQLVAQLEAAVR